MAEPEQIIAGLSEAQKNAIRYNLEWSEAAGNYYIPIELNVTRATLKALDRKGVVDWCAPYYRAWLTEDGDQVRNLLIESE